MREAARASVPYYAGRSPCMQCTIVLPEPASCVHRRICSSCDLGNLDELVILNVNDAASGTCDGATLHTRPQLHKRRVFFSHVKFCIAPDSPLPPARPGVCRPRPRRPYRPPPPSIGVRPLPAKIGAGAPRGTCCCCCCCFAGLPLPRPRTIWKGKLLSAALPGCPPLLAGPTLPPGPLPFCWG